MNVDHYYLKLDYDVFLEQIYGQKIMIKYILNYLNTNKDVL